MVNGIAHGFIMSEALQAVCGKAQLDQNHPELNKIFEKVKQNQHEQITLSCSSEKPESKSWTELVNFLEIKFVRVQHLAIWKTT